MRADEIVKPGAATLPRGFHALKADAGPVGNLDPVETHKDAPLARTHALPVTAEEE